MFNFLREEEARGIQGQELIGIEEGLQWGYRGDGEIEGPFNIL